MKRLPPEREMRKAFLHADASFDGIFILAVRTTGVFCRPSCRARKPRPENVEYFAAPRDALAAGYRPCKRCRPLLTNGQPPDWLTPLLDRMEKDPGRRLRDEDLRALRFDPARVRRYFRRHFGMTFQEYHRARRLGTALGRLGTGGRLLDVAHDSGYDSNSGFRAAFQRAFGNTPGRGRAADCIVSTLLTSPLGPLIACASGSAVCLLEFADRDELTSQVASLPERFATPVVPGSNGLLRALRGELSEYFAGRRRRFSVPLDYQGTPFQHSVWQQLLRIPYGHTWSYAELAERVGRSGGQRAVGQANGRNPIAILIPCHRVVNKSGQLGGYGGGLWRKQYLLDLERGTREPGGPRP